jgi:undecaprenyl-diphosphatase
MDTFIEILKAIFIGIVQGITEWLPVSSTGHMIIANEFIHLNVSDDCWNLFEVITQLGSILAVVILFFDKLNPFSKKKTPEVKKKPWDLWFKVIVAVLPSAVLGVLLDDWMDEKLYNFVVVAITLVIYGVAFLFVEKLNKSGPKTLVYVSCDPTTLARDVKLLKNYKADTVTPVDMFPRTGHVESVVSLTRRDNELP